MQTNSRFFDDIARMANGAAGALGGVKSEIESLVTGHLERILANMDLVPREEFEAVRDMAAKARIMQEKLTARIDELETRLAQQKRPAAKKTTPRKPAAKTARK